MTRSRRITHRLTPPRVLALGYASVIALGTLLLNLPFAHEQPVSFGEALFTAVSAATVTGLTVVDTGTTWSTFGEAVLVALMQVGGLGLMTFAVLTSIVLGRRVGLRQRIIFGEAMAEAPMGSVARLVRSIVLFTLAMEAAGTALLALTFVPDEGWATGLWHSVFHAVSAFNNAGFGLRSDSLVAHVGDPLVNVVITALFITGGIGFTVLADLRRQRTWRLLSLHTRLMLVGTLAFSVVAALAIFLLERGNPETLGALSGSEQAWAAWFQGTTPRTAGFNTIDTGAMTDTSLLLTMLLMFIGAGSASTASGIKLTTFLVVMLAAFAFLRGHVDATAFGRRIPPSIVLRALAIGSIATIFVFGGILLLTVFETQPFLQLAFEGVSAFGTVGLSTGITADLGAAGRGVLMVMMFFGRIGPLSLVFILARPHETVVRYPDGDVMTG